MRQQIDNYFYFFYHADRYHEPDSTRLAASSTSEVTPTALFSNCRSRPAKPHACVAPLQETASHIRSHAAESDHSQLHTLNPFGRMCLPARSPKRAQEDCRRL